MLAIERRKLILEQLHREKRVVVSELSRKFSVSEETIRRDLEKFEKDDLVTKSYGGAVLGTPLSQHGEPGPLPQSAVPSPTPS